MFTSLRGALSGRHYVLQLLGLCACAVASAAQCLPVLSGFSVQEYAAVTDPLNMAFAPDGTLFVSRDNVGSAGGFSDSIRIHRVSPGGNVVSEYGAVALADPDAITFDATGTLSGVPGSVLVGSGGVGIIAIHPDESIATVFPIGAIGNGDVDYLGFDSTGRLVMIAGLDTLRWTTGGIPTVFIDATSLTSTPLAFAIDGQSRIYLTGLTGNIDVFAPDGSRLVAGFVTSISNGGFSNHVSLAFGRGGEFGTDLYAMNTVGDLFRIAGDGGTTLYGSGFASAGLLTAGSTIAFGPDQALYVAEFPNDRILRVAGAQQTLPEPDSLALIGVCIAMLVYANAPQVLSKHRVHPA